MPLYNFIRNKCRIKNMIEKRKEKNMQSFKGLLGLLRWAYRFVCALALSQKHAKTSRNFL